MLRVAKKVINRLIDSHNRKQGRILANKLLYIFMPDMSPSSAKVWVEFFADTVVHYCDAIFELSVTGDLKTPPKKVLEFYQCLDRYVKDGYVLGGQTKLVHCRIPPSSAACIANELEKFCCSLCRAATNKLNAPREYALLN